MRSRLALVAIAVLVRMLATRGLVWPVVTQSTPQTVLSAPEGLRPHTWVGGADAWHPGSIDQLLTNHAVLGELQPHHTVVNPD